MNGKTYNQQYYQANIDRIKLYAQLYYIKHKEIFKRRYIENREAIMERIKHIINEIEKSNDDINKRITLLLTVKEEKQKQWEIKIGRAHV